MGASGKKKRKEKKRKEPNRACKITSKTNFMRGTSSVPTGAKVSKFLLVLKFGHPPLFFHSLGPIPAMHASASRGSREENVRGVKFDGGGGKDDFFNFAPAGAKINDSMGPSSGWLTSWIHSWPA